MKLTKKIVQAIRNSKDIFYKGKIVGSIRKSVSINGDATLIAHFEILKQEPKSTSKKYKKCCECGKRNETVKQINCGYHMDLKGKKVKEIICEACEKIHLNEI